MTFPAVGRAAAFDRLPMAETLPGGNRGENGTSSATTANRRRNGDGARLESTVSP
ncbi:hypothetical protein [Natronobacterium lacisalsi]|uniref:hypothetical protein n=1 Tax=Natronobacterium lacisalsi TaxID=229731 RepID=UPI0012EB486D|nr:hypothetical protein [Halobiforma lacisalsi]